MVGLQRMLVEMGHPVFWYDDVPVGSTAFAAMQMGAARGWWTADAATLHGEPDAAVKASEAAAALSALRPARNAPNVAGTAQLTWADLGALGYDTGPRLGIVRRNQFAEWMLSLVRLALLQN